MRRNLATISYNHENGVSTDPSVSSCSLDVSTNSSSISNNISPLDHNKNTINTSPDAVKLEVSKSLNSSRFADNRRIFFSFFAGVGSSAVASVFCAPLDLIRTRLQVMGPTRRNSGLPTPSIMMSVREIVHIDGFRGCFRGLGATLLTVPTFWGMYFSLYETAKRELNTVVYIPDDEGGMIVPTPPEVHIVSALIAGAISDIVCNPLFVVRTRMQTEALHYFERTLEERKPHGILSTVRGLYREGGNSIFIFWRGLSASLLGLSHVAIQFPVYERLKIETRRHKMGREESPIELLLASALSKMTATTLTYPHEVLRSRMMDMRVSTDSPTSLTQTFRRIVEKEGTKALYHGLDVTLIRVIPNACITFLSYEMIMRYSKFIIKD